MTVTEQIQYLRDFAHSLGCELVTEGTVGFNRPCVGIIDPQIGSYVDYNPVDYDAFFESNDSTIDKYFYFGYNSLLEPPADVTHAYHKHSCMAVLSNGIGNVAAIDQLYKWVKSILANAGDSGSVVKLVKYRINKNFNEWGDPYKVAIVLEKN